MFAQRSFRLKRVPNRFPVSLSGWLSGLERLSMVHERQEKIASRSSKVRPLANVFNALNRFVNHGFQQVCLSG